MTLDSAGIGSFWHHKEFYWTVLPEEVTVLIEINQKLFKKPTQFLLSYIRDNKKHKY